MSCPQIWNIEQEKDREKEKKRQASETQREKGRQRSRARDKNKGDFFLLEEQHENFVAAVKKSEQEQLRHFLHKKVSGSFTF